MAILVSSHEKATGERLIRGCCKLKTCGNPGSQSDPNFPVFMRKSHENAPRMRGKGELPDCIHAVPWAEARKCNSPVSFIVDNWEFQEFLKKLLTIIKIYGIIEK